MSGIEIDTGAATPLSERLQENRETQAEVEFTNVQLKGHYDRAVQNYIDKTASHPGPNPAGVNTDPIPNPPMKWVTQPQAVRTQIEIEYDLRFQLPPRLEIVKGNEPVAPKYVPPSGGITVVIPGTVIHIGPFMHTEQRVIGGNTVDVAQFASMPDDNMPDGFGVPWQYGGKGIMLHKRVTPSPFPPLVYQWYEGVLG